MTFYEVLLVLHVFAAIIWLGAAFVLAVLVYGAERAGDKGREAGYHADVDWLSTRLFIPASLSVLVIGILLMIDGSWSLDTLWIAIGLGGWIATFLIGILFFKPEAEKIAALMEEHGPGHPEVAERIRRVNIVDRLDLLVLFLIVADMVVKPTGDDTGVLIGAAAIIAVVGLATASALRRQPTTVAAETAR
jgi:uncharacterized membrane protein